MYIEQKIMLQSNRSSTCSLHASCEANEITKPTVRHHSKDNLLRITQSDNIDVLNKDPNDEVSMIVTKQSQSDTQVTFDHVVVKAPTHEDRGKYKAFVKKHIVKFV